MGLIIGAIWGLLSTVIFVTVGMFGSPSHAYYWLYRLFQVSVDTVWFQTLFLPFVMLAPHYPTVAIFTATPFGAIIGLSIGIIISVISHLIRK